MNIRSTLFASLMLCCQASSGLVSAIAQTQGTFVSGIAVYKDGRSGNVEKVPGVDLYLAITEHRGPLPTLPTSIRDQDTTCSRVNGDRPQDEGLFQLYSASSVDIVSVIYKRRAGDPNDPPQPEYFSTVLHPSLRRERDRFVRKLEFELWPTDRAVTDAVVFTSLVRGIILSHVAMQRLREGKEAKEDIVGELSDLVELLPEDEELRHAMVEYMRKRLPPMLPEAAREALKLIPFGDDRFWTPKGDKGERAAQNREKWIQFRMYQLQPQTPRQVQPNR